MSSKDLYSYWTESYLKHHQKSYHSTVAWLYELKLLNLLTKEHGDYAVFLAIDNALSQSQLSIQQFYVNALDFISQHEHLELVYFVKRYGTSHQKKQWDKYIILDAEWFPTATTLCEKNKIIDELTIWSSGIKDSING